MPAFVRISLLAIGASLWSAAAQAPVPAERARANDPAPAGSFSKAPQAPAMQATDSLRISLLTILPGSDIYSLWGHSAVRIIDEGRGLDLSYNYGTFAFETSFFVARFLHGSLEYRLGVHRVDAAIHQYRAEGRPVIEQVLDLSPEQKVSLQRFLQLNARPEHRSYRYHFLFDNCSTRIRDALEQALDGAVRFDDVPDPQTTFRELIDPYQRAVPFLDAGIDWLLGAPVDRVALPQETMFLPDYLLRAFDEAVVEVDGSARPLVVRKDTLLWIDGYEPPGHSFPWEAGVAWLIFGTGLVVTIRTRSTKRSTKRGTVPGTLPGPGTRQGLGRNSGPGYARAFDAPLFLTVGLAGVLIAYLWFISHHDVTENNWHLLWAWPTHLIAGVAMLRRRREVPRWLPGYAAASALMALVVIAGAPVWPQALHPVLVPITLLVALRGGAFFFAGRRHIGSARPASP